MKKIIIFGLFLTYFTGTHAAGKAEKAAIAPISENELQKIIQDQGERFVLIGEEEKKKRKIVERKQQEEILKRKKENVDYPIEKAILEWLLQDGKISSAIKERQDQDKKAKDGDKKPLSADAIIALLTTTVKRNDQQDNCSVLNFLLHADQASTIKLVVKMMAITKESDTNLQLKSIFDIRVDRGNGSQTEKTILDVLFEQHQDETIDFVLAHVPYLRDKLLRILQNNPSFTEDKKKVEKILAALLKSRQSENEYNKLSDLALSKILISSVKDSKDNNKNICLLFAQIDQEMTQRLLFEYYQTSIYSNDLKDTLIELLKFKDAKSEDEINLLLSVIFDGLIENREKFDSEGLNYLSDKDLLEILSTPIKSVENKKQEHNLFSRFLQLDHKKTIELISLNLKRKVYEDPCITKRPNLVEGFLKAVNDNEDKKKEKIKQLFYPTIFDAMVKVEASFKDHTLWRYASVLHKVLDISVNKKTKMFSLFFEMDPIKTMTLLVNNIYGNGSPIFQLLETMSVKEFKTKTNQEGTPLGNLMLDTLYDNHKKIKKAGLINDDFYKLYYAHLTTLFLVNVGKKEGIKKQKNIFSLFSEIDQEKTKSLLGFILEYCRYHTEQYNLMMNNISKEEFLKKPQNNLPSLGEIVLNWATEGINRELWNISPEGISTLLSVKVGKDNNSRKNTTVLALFEKINSEESKKLINYATGKVKKSTSAKKKPTKEEQNDKSNALSEESPTTKKKFTKEEQSKALSKDKVQAPTWGIVLGGLVLVSAITSGIAKYLSDKKKEPQGRNRSFF